jgi:hypothetical protein
MSFNELVTRLELPPLAALTEIENKFLHECKKLKEVVFGDPSAPNQALPKLKRLGADVMSKCSAIRTLELPPMPSLQFIGVNFMSSCASLTELLWGKKGKPETALPNLKEIGELFLSNCAQLTTLRLPPLPDDIRVGNPAFAGSPNLKTFYIGKENVELHR